MITIRPQPGAQEQFLSNPADIVIYGGAAGGGKSWALLMECLRHVKNSQFNAVLFRRTFPQIRNPGGLWDASMGLFPFVGAQARNSALQWVFPCKSTVRFSHMKLETDKLSWQGSEIPLIGFDELTHFTESQFWYMMSRNRSTSGVRPYIRCTTNADADSWVRGLIDWWIDDDGFPRRDRAGWLKYFVRENDKITWVEPEHPDAKSLTFIPATLRDNQILMLKDPGYLANLKALPLVERERLLSGNWNIKPSAGKVFRAEWFGIIQHAIPSNQVRFWDFASSEKQNAGDDPDYTVGVKMMGDVVVDIIRIRQTPEGVNRAIVNIASQDTRVCKQRWWRDPGQAGVYQDHQLREILKGYDALGIPSTLSKYDRAKPASAAAEQGKIKLLQAPWNRAFLAELQLFPDGDHDDQVDAFAGAYNFLTGAIASPSKVGKAKW